MGDTDIIQTTARKLADTVKHTENKDAEQHSTVTAPSRVYARLYQGPCAISTRYKKVNIIDIMCPQAPPTRPGDGRSRLMIHTKCTGPL